jgi:hypothetical protein
MPRQRTEAKMTRGINKDLSPFELPIDKWSDGNNVNFRRIRTNSTVGYSNPYTVGTDINGTFSVHYKLNGVNNWLYAGQVGDTDEGAIYSTDGNITRKLLDGLHYARDAEWTGCDFNSGIVINNRLNHPLWLSWPYTSVIPLPNWFDTDNYNATWNFLSRCNVMRPYKNYLIALDNYDATGKRFPNMVRWSSPAQLGDPPVDWNPDIIGEQAGTYPLADTPGDVIDGLTLGDYFIVYKTDSAWLMQFIGGQFVMKFRKLFGDSAGILARDCVAEFNGKHFVLSTNGAYVHNAASKEEIMDNWVKDELWDNVDPDYVQDTKVVADHNNSEIWVYYISKNAENGPNGPYADKALIWNWEEAEWTKKDLNGISYIAEGYIVPTINPQTDSWNTDFQAWDEDTTPWDNEVSFTTGLETLLMTDFYENKFYANEYAQGTDLQNETSWVQRIGIDFDHDRGFKYLTRVIPHIIGQTPVDITVYVSDIQTPNPVPVGTYTFDPLNQEDIDVHAVGRYIGLKFACEGEFQLNGYTLEWEPAGQF